MGKNKSETLKVKEKDILEFGNDDYEKKYVLNVYNQIAQHFNNTRYKQWANIASYLISKTKNKSLIVLDVGCGNSKYSTAVSSNSIYFGLDFSTNLLEQAKSNLEKNLLHFTKIKEYAIVDFCVANCLNIPFKTKSVDITICIAVLHHLSSRNRRVMAVNKMIDATKSDGEILIYVWAREQRENSIGTRKFDSRNNLVPWINSATQEMFYRYYSVFTFDEIIEEIEEACENKAEIINSYYDSNNWAITIKVK